MQVAIRDLKSKLWFLTISGWTRHERWIRVEPVVRRWVRHVQRKVAGAWFVWLGTDVRLVTAD